MAQGGPGPEDIPCACINHAMARGLSLFRRAPAPGTVRSQQAHSFLRLMQMPDTVSANLGSMPRPIQVV